MDQICLRLLPDPGITRRELTEARSSPSPPRAFRFFVTLTSFPEEDHDRHLIDGNQPSEDFGGASHKDPRSGRLFLRWEAENRKAGICESSFRSLRREAWLSEEVIRLGASTFGQGTEVVKKPFHVKAWVKMGERQNIARLPIKAINNLKVRFQENNKADFFDGKLFPQFFEGGVMHLTPEELAQAYIDGPFVLLEHDEENRAHMHIFHEGCHECLEKLLLLREMIVSAGIPV